jgi:hypothetical protein
MQKVLGNLASVSISKKLLFLLALLMVIAGTAYAQTRSIHIVLNGRLLNGSGIIYNERVYIPATVIEQITGAKVRWNSGRWQIEIDSGSPEPQPVSESDQPVLLFEDNFNDSMKLQWRQEPLNMWTTANGDLICAEHDYNKTYLTVVGDLSWKDYCIDVDVYNPHQWTSPAYMAIVCCYTNSNNYTAFVIRPEVSFSKAYWITKKEGRISEEISPVKIAISGEESFHLRLICRGKELFAYKNDLESPLLTYGSAGGTGKAGILLGYGMDCRFDNFRVVRLYPGAPVPPSPKFKNWNR